MIINYYSINLSLITEYIYIYIALIISVLISVILYGLIALITFKQYDLEKISAYECGFHPFEDTREKFNIRFYLVAILFIIFDLEITFLFPWAICLRVISFLGFFVMFIFLLVLTLGFLYEWMRTALDWE